MALHNQAVAALTSKIREGIAAVHTRVPGREFLYVCQGISNRNT